MHIQLDYFVNKLSHSLIYGILTIYCNYVVNELIALSIMNHVIKYNKVFGNVL